MKALRTGFTLKVTIRSQLREEVHFSMSQP
jgi:hypothetical protein